jgi:hypothetical protein
MPLERVVVVVVVVVFIFAVLFDGSLPSRS